ncbi:Double-stranded RNA-binding domain [Macleaya cordata]|uniref:Double-stranded RNA-binding domain n=1 Tax=Macleaya cordata TaxID=56857 RepID=A0A200PRM3_MACCD|nr:Double-stranded RNA-binding domain [Macleaya cordata]
MYKSRLQELCHQKLWSLPNYTVIKDGLDHNPRFKASVLINGVSFDTPDFCRSSKEAQNEAARLAFHHFTSPDPHLSTENPVKNSSSSSSSPSPEIRMFMSYNWVLPTDIQSLHKNLLQNYAQRRNLSLPVYSCVREGPPHAVRFKANVTVDEQTFEGPEFCRTLKEAEHAAARVALTSLSHDVSFYQDDTGFYKNLLQDFLRKEGLSLPTYKTNSSGSSHLPIFTSTVEIGVDVFQGIAKTKKQAEMNAAKVAYSCLKERGLYRNPPSLFQSSQAEEALQYTSSTPHSTFNVDLQQNIKPGESLVLTSSVKSGERRKERKGSNEEDNSSKTIVDVGQFSTRPSMPSFPKPGINSSPKNKESDMIYARLRDPFPSPPSSPDDNEPSSPTTVSQFSNPSSFTTNVNTELPLETKSSLLCNRVRVYPRKPDMVFPKGITVMPISDDKWVAVSLDFPSEEVIAFFIELVSNNMIKLACEVHYLSQESNWKPSLVFPELNQDLYENAHRM